MPDGNWYRVSGLPTGVNFRATNFRSAVPPARVCSVCRLIPTRLFLLPCSHTVCKSCWDVCFGACPLGGVSCPLDGVHFDVEDCHDISLSPDKVMKMEVASWNSLHGCETTGTLADVLEHFERDCTFHEAICGRCQARVVQSDIADHLRRGCTDNSEPATRTTQGDSVSSREQRPLNLEDFKDALDELKIVLTTNGSNVVSVLETKVDELTENIRSLKVTALELVETSKNDGAELCQQLLQAQSALLTSWRNSLQEEAVSPRTETKDAFTSARISTRNIQMQTNTPVGLLQSEAQTKTNKDAFTSARISTRYVGTQTDTPVGLLQSEAQKRPCKESAASSVTVSGTLPCNEAVSGGKADGRETLWCKVDCLLKFGELPSAEHHPATDMSFPQPLCGTSSRWVQFELRTERDKNPTGQNFAGNSSQRATQPAQEVASFITQVERKGIGRSEHRLEFTGWQSFKTRAAETDQHVYATCTVWYSEQSWFRVLLYLQALEGNVLHLTAYVKLRGSKCQMAAVQRRELGLSSFGGLRIAHPSGERALFGTSLSDWRPVGFNSRHYAQFICVPVKKLEEDGYVVHDTIQFHIFLERV